MHVGYTDARILNAVTTEFTGRQTDFVNILNTLTVLGKDNSDCWEPMGEEVIAGRFKVHNEVLHNLNSSNIISMFKSRGRRYADHVARLGDKRILYESFVRKTKRELPATL
jgi:hypothetical protein